MTWKDASRLALEGAAHDRSDLHHECHGAPTHLGARGRSGSTPTGRREVGLEPASSMNLFG